MYILDLIYTRILHVTVCYIILYYYILYSAYTYTSARERATAILFRGRPASVFTLIRTFFPLEKRFD